MDVDHHREFVFQRVGDDKIHPRKNFRRQREIRRGTGVMMPAHRHAHVVKAFRAHDGAFVRREGHAPVLFGRRFEIIAEVCPAHEKFCRPIRRRVVAGMRFHLRRVGRLERGVGGWRLSRGNLPARRRPESEKCVSCQSSLVTFNPSHANHTPSGNSACALSWS